jgi:hypothetical protein
MPAKAENGFEIVGNDFKQSLAGPQAESLNGRTAVWTRTARPQAEAQGCAESLHGSK